MSSKLKWRKYFICNHIKYTQLIFCNQTKMVKHSALYRRKFHVCTKIMHPFGSLGINPLYKN